MDCHFNSEQQNKRCMDEPIDVIEKQDEQTGGKFWPIVLVTGINYLIIRYLVSLYGVLTPKQKRTLSFPNIVIFSWIFFGVCGALALLMAREPEIQEVFFGASRTKENIRRVNVGQATDAIFEPHPVAQTLYWIIAIIASIWFGRLFSDFSTKLQVNDKEKDLRRQLADALRRNDEAWSRWKAILEEERKWKDSHSQIKP